MKKKTSLENLQLWVTKVKSCRSDSLESAVQGAIHGAIGSALDIPFDRIGNPAERYIVDAIDSYPIGTVANKPGPMWYEAVVVVRFPVVKKTTEG